jgi:hypothetical protein
VTIDSEFVPLIVSMVEKSVVDVLRVFLKLETWLVLVRGFRPIRRLLVNLVVVGQFGACENATTQLTSNLLIDQGRRPSTREREKSEIVCFSFVDTQPPCDGFGLG